MKPLTILSFLIALTHGKPPRFCDEPGMVQRPYGHVEKRVDTTYLASHGFMDIAEYRGDTLHGFSIRYDKNCQKRNSNFYINNKRDGWSYCWDSLGSILCKEQFRNGKSIGLRESYFSPGKPAMMKTYNDSGVPHGYEKVWWKNGNLRHEFKFDRGSIIASEEYFPNGKIRLRHRRPYQPPGKTGILKWKLAQGETWAPNGKPTGKVKDGNGRLLRFSAQPDSVTGRYRVWDDTYKDSLLSNAGELDSAEVSKWLK